MNPELAKEKFLINELFSLAWAASVQRNLIYSSNISDNRKADFRNKLKLFIFKDIVPQYKKKVSEKQHVSNIEKLIILAKGNSVLRSGRYSFGTAQKLLNTLLKYLWVCNLIREPPHYPIDRIILANAGSNYSWTQMKNLEGYLVCISILKEKAQGASLAIWELNNFKRRSTIV